MTARALVWAFVLGCPVLLGAAASCGRRSGLATTPESTSAAPLPGSEFEASTRGAADIALVEAGLPRPVGRKPVPVIVDGHAVSGTFARAAAPGPGHPKGTIAVFHDEYAKLPGDLPRKTGNLMLVEIDLASAAPVRSVPIGKDIELYGLGDGTRGPVAYLQSNVALTLVWLDSTLTVLARHSFPQLGRNKVEPCAYGVVGDHAILADRGEDGLRTRLWDFDARGGETSRSCPVASGLGFFEIERWKGRAVVFGISDGPLWHACSFLPGGTPGIRVGSYPYSQRVLAREGSLYVFSPRTRDDDRPYFALADDMRPTGNRIAEPRPPEIVEAERLIGYASILRASLVEGVLVLRALHCCGETGPSLYVFDPHADAG